MTLENILLKKFGDSFRPNVNLSNYSWFNLGGNAEYFYKAKNKNQLIEFLKEATVASCTGSLITATSYALTTALFRPTSVVPGASVTPIKVYNDHISTARANWS